MGQSKRMSGTFRWINAWGEDAGSGRAEATLEDGRLTMTLYHDGYVYGVVVESHTNVGAWQCIDEDEYGTVTVGVFPTKGGFDVEGPWIEEGEEYLLRAKLKPVAALAHQ